MTVMPVCYICGGDMSAQPTQVWAAIDMKQDNTRHCPECNETIKSLLTMECPNCNAALPVPGMAIEDGEKEKEKFNQMVQAAEAEDKAAAAAAAPVAPAPEPVAPPIPEPVAPPTPVAKAPELPPIPERPVAEPVVSLPTPPAPSAPKAAPQEGFFAKLLRLFGLKK
jgi:cell division septation protein DedD